MRYLVALFILLLPTASLAQRASHCIAIAQAPGLEYVHRASFRDPLEDFSVRISYLAHSMFLIQSASGPSAVTDYTGFVGSTGFFPDVATMNNAHDSHWTAFPDNRIPHVLPGWPVGGEKANHRIQVGDMLV
ncbi:MAG: MBL fold metallo-hydrolase, partial [Pseudomonadota bacterium]